MAAITGLVLTAGTTAASFAQASKQKKLQREAEADAKKYMTDARKALEVNFYEQLGIQKEPYELAREAVTSTAAQAIEAGRESERGATPTSGRIFLGAQKGQRDIATQMGQEMQQLDKLVAAEDASLRDKTVALDLEQAAGAQVAAREAETRAQQASQQAIKGLSSLATQADALKTEYGKTASSRQFGKLAEGAKEAGLSQAQFQQQLAAFGSKTPTFGNLAGVGAMDPTAFAAFMGGLNADYLKQLAMKFNPTGIYTQPPAGQGMIGPEF